MAASMRDVANLAGVSQRTVSNVVNDFVHVSPETRQKVQDAITALKFRPNVAAQRLRRGKTGLIALAMPEIAAPYFAELADHIQQVASARGVTLLIEQTDGRRDQELALLDGYQANVIDGLILSAISVSAEDLEERDLDFPTVLLGESVGPSTLLHVSVDNVAAARAATEHLIALGRRNLAFVGAPEPDDVAGPAYRRMQGFQEAVRLAGLELASPAYFRPSRWSRSEGYAIGSTLARDGSGFDGVFCCNDLLAIGVMKGLSDNGAQVPNDIAVIGWDDIDESAYSTPRLTSIAPDKSEIARIAIEGLLAPDGQAAEDAREVYVPFHLRVRESTTDQRR